MRWNRRPSRALNVVINAPHPFGRLSITRRALPIERSMRAGLGDLDRRRQTAHAFQALASAAATSCAPRARLEPRLDADQQVVERTGALSSIT